MKMFKLAMLSTFSIVLLSSLSGGVYGSSENSFLPSAINSRDFSGLKRLAPNGPNPAQSPEQDLSSSRRNSGVRRLLLTKEASASTVNEWSSNHFQPLKSSDVGVTWDVPSGPNPIQNKSPPPAKSADLVDPTGRYPPSGPNPGEPPAAVYSSHLISSDVGVTWDVPSGPNPIQNKSPPPAEPADLVDPTGRYPPSGPNPGEPPAAVYPSHLKSSDVGVTWDVPSGPNPIQNKSPPPVESADLVDPTGRYPPSGPNPGEPPAAVYSSHLKSSDVGVTWDVPAGPNLRQPPVAVESTHFVITGKGQVPPSAPSPGINPTVPVEWSHSKYIAITKKGQVPPSAPSPGINPPVGPNYEEALRN